MRVGGGGVMRVGGKAKADARTRACPDCGAKVGDLCQKLNSVGFTEGRRQISVHAGRRCPTDESVPWDEGGGAMSPLLTKAEAEARKAEAEARKAEADAAEVKLHELRAQSLDGMPQEYHHPLATHSTQIYCMTKGLLVLDCHLPVGVAMPVIVTLMCITVVTRTKVTGSDRILLTNLGWTSDDEITWRLRS